jgi:uncharacterized membrane protein SpoIIM required for sporulation
MADGLVLMSSDLTAGSWLKSRSAVWNQWSAQSSQPQRGLRVEDAQRRVERYRAIARDLATARVLLPASRATAALESLYVATHASIDVATPLSSARLLRLLRDEIPAEIRALRATILWLALLMAVTVFAGWWLITEFPELVSLVASPQMIDGVEHGHLWTEGMLSVTPRSILSAQILSNNIIVSLFAFCAGTFFGLGSLYIVATNGLMLGALFAFTHQHGMDGELLKFVLAHGPVEISVMCIAGAAGTALGEALIRPGSLTRHESFQRASKRAVRVLLACALLLIICGIFEGFVSPDPGMPMATRAVVGLAYWFLMLMFLNGHLLRRKAPA